MKRKYETNLTVTLRNKKYHRELKINLYKALQDVSEIELLFKTSTEKFLSDTDTILRGK